MKSASALACGCGHLLDLLLADRDVAHVVVTDKVLLGSVERRLLALDIGFGLPQRQLKAVAVDAEENVSLLHDLVVAHKNLADEAGDVRGDLNDICTDASIARPRLELIMDPKPPSDEYGEPDNHECRDQRGRVWPTGKSLVNLRKKQDAQAEQANKNGEIEKRLMPDEAVDAGVAQAAGDDGHPQIRNDGANENGWHKTPRC